MALKPEALIAIMAVVSFIQDLAYNFAWLHVIDGRRTSSRATVELHSAAERKHSKLNRPK
jgi:hypothetical protein